MKPLLTVILLFISVSQVLYGQQADTVKIKIYPAETVQLQDSLTGIRSSRNNLSPAYNHLKKQLQRYSDDATGFNSNNSVDIPQKYIIPITLISYGIISRGNKSLQKIDYNIQNKVNRHIKGHIPLDDYSQFIPVATLYGLDLGGIRAKHNFRDRTIVVATSYIIMGLTVQKIKSSVSVWRPNKSNDNSFPSGHTATAFTGAHILFKEYKDSSTWIGITGYAVALGTGTLRVLNKAHWVSDVITGAGIGILSAEAGYVLLPLFHKILWIKDSKKLVIVPTGISNWNIGLIYTL